MYRLLLFLLLVMLVSCNQPKVQSASAGDISSEVPEWIRQGNIYEVNVRQFTPEGTLPAFMTHLERLKNMGVQTLWFMPVQPISRKDRKGVLGSYYAIADYTAINPEFGTMDDWKNLVKQAQAMGFKVILDWVANHSGADHPWLEKHPDFYEKDSTGNPIAPFDWTDVRKLDYKNPALVDSMIAAMQFWVRETGIDGFRCDVAAEVPAEFWKKAIAALKTVKPVFMLAEANDAWLYEAGFHATYPWDEFHTTRQIAAGERNALSLDSQLMKLDSTLPHGAIRMYFTSNHDENSWNKADYGTMPGAVHAPFAVLSQTWKRSVPLIYSGQEEPFLDSLSFFYKDTIQFGNFARAPFYKTLLDLRKQQDALASDASFKKLATHNDAAVYAFEREGRTSRVLVILNLGAQEQEVRWKKAPSDKQWNNVFTGRTEKTDMPIKLEPWAYRVYLNKK